MLRSDPTIRPPPAQKSRAMGAAQFWSSRRTRQRRGRRKTSRCRSHGFRRGQRGGSKTGAASSLLRPLRPSTFALGITRRFPGCRSRQPSFLDLPPRLRQAVALAAAAVLRPQILSPSQPFVRHSRRDGITSVVLARQEFAARQERPPSRGAAPKEFNGALSVRHSRAEMATDMNANININQTST